MNENALGLALQWAEIMLSGPEEAPYAENAARVLVSIQKRLAEAEAVCEAAVPFNNSHRFGAAPAPTFEQECALGSALEAWKKAKETT